VLEKWLNPNFKNLKLIKYVNVFNFFYNFKLHLQSYNTCLKCLPGSAVQVVTVVLILLSTLFGVSVVHFKI